MKPGKPNLQFVLLCVLMIWQLVFATNTVAQPSTEPFSGLWLMPDGAASLEIFLQSQDANSSVLSNYGIRIVAIRDTHFTSADGDKNIGQQRVDINNPDVTLRGRPLPGLLIGEEFQVRDGRLVGGKLYDPGSGNTYRAEIEHTNDGMLRVRGYIGNSLFGRTMYWHAATAFRRRFESMFME